MNNKYLYFSILCFFYSNLFSQINLIKNPGFESGNSNELNYRSNFHNGLGNDNWTDDYECDPDGNYAPHSPDWFSNQVSYTGRIAPITTRSGDKCVGTSTWELFQQDISTNLFGTSPLIPYRPYYLQFYYYAMKVVNSTAYPEPYESHNLNIVVYLCTNKANYNSNDCSNLDYSCTSNYKSFNAGEKVEIARFPIFESNQGESLTNQWIKKAKVFMAPPNNYNWFVVQIENVTQNDEGSNSCIDGFVLFDDFSLFSFCETPCAPELGDIEVYSSANATFTFTETCHVAVDIGGGVLAHPSTFCIGNAMGYELRVFDDFGGQIYECFEHDLHGLIDPEINIDFPNRQNPWSFSWNGNDRNNTNLPVDVYPFRLDIWNCRDKQDNTFTTLGTFTKVGTCDEGIPMEIPCYQNSYFNVSECCELCVQYNTFTLPVLNNSAKECIKIRENFEMGVQGVSNLEAGEEISFLDEITLNEGSKVSATIDNCGDGVAEYFRKPNRPAFINESLFHNNFTIDNLKNYFIFPNPTNEKIICEFKGNIVHQYRLINILGKIVENVSFNDRISKIDVNFLDKPKGGYLLEIYTDEGVIREKIIYQ